MLAKLKFSSPAPLEHYVFISEKDGKIIEFRWLEWCTSVLNYNQCFIEIIYSFGFLKKIRLTELHFSFLFLSVTALNFKSVWLSSDNILILALNSVSLVIHQFLFVALQVNFYNLSEEVKDVWFPSECQPFYAPSVQYRTVENNVKYTAV